MNNSIGKRPSVLLTGGRLCIFLILWLVLPRAAGAQSVHPLYDADLDRACGLMLSMDLEGARRIIDNWIWRSPGRPDGYFYRAVLYSWRIFLLPEEDEPGLLRDEFEKAIRDCRIRAEKISARRETAFEGTLYLGAIYGQEALLALIDRKYLIMAPLAKQAWLNVSKVLEMDPQFYDGYFGKGIYLYFTDLLPTAIKLLAQAYGFEGDRQQGLADLRLAGEKGLYSRDASRLMLLNIYALIERPDSAVRELGRELYARYPDDPLIHWRYGDILLRMKDYAAAEKIFSEVAERLERGFPYYRNRMFTAHSMAYRLGVCDWNMGKSREAMARFDSILAAEKISPDWVEPFVYLEQGKIYLSRNDRVRARQAWEKTLDCPDYFGSREEAERLLDMIGGR